MKPEDYKDSVEEKVVDLSPEEIYRLEEEAKGGEEVPKTMTLQTKTSYKFVDIMEEQEIPKEEYKKLLEAEPFKAVPKFREVKVG